MELATMDAKTKTVNGMEETVMAQRLVLIAHALLIAYTMRSVTTNVLLLHATGTYQVALTDFAHPAVPLIY